MEEYKKQTNLIDALAIGGGGAALIHGLLTGDKATLSMGGGALMYCLTDGFLERLYRDATEKI